MTKFEIEEKIVDMLKTVFDPEIPVNIYDLGLIYKIDVSETGEVVIDMTLTAPNCPAADFSIRSATSTCGSSAQRRCLCSCFSGTTSRRCSPR